MGTTSRGAGEPAKPAGNQKMESRRETTSAQAAEELEHLALAASISGISVEIVLPTSHDFARERMRLHYLDWGSEGRRPMVFLHGAALNARTWDVVCLMLRQQHHCYAIDQRGHGESAWAEDADYSGDAHRRDIEAFVDHLGLDQFVLVGHSMGGFNAFNYAYHNSHRLAALVLVDAGPSMLGKGTRRIIDFVKQTAELDSLDEVLKKAMAFNPRRDPRLLRRSLLHNFRQAASGKWVRKTDPRMWEGKGKREQEREKLEERFRQAAARISCPALIVRGGLSEVFTAEDAQKLADNFPRGRYVQVGEAGHTVQGDNPTELGQALSRFLADALP